MNDIEITKITALPKTSYRIDTPEGRAIINEAVATGLGWKETYVQGSVFGQLIEAYWLSPDGQKHQSVPDYCHDIKAAFEIVVKLRRDMFLLSVIFMKRYVTCEIGTHENPLCSESADTAPMAICLAFLKLLSCGQ